MKALVFWTIQLGILVGVFTASWISFSVYDQLNTVAQQSQGSVLALVDEPVQFYHDSEAPDPGLVHTIINDIRDDSSFSRLATSQKLTTIAEQRLLDMQANGYYAHYNPESNETFADMLRDVSSEHIFACENLNLTFSAGPQATVEDWLNSPSHKSCLMNSQAQYAGYASASLRIPGQQQAFVVVAIYSAEPSN